MAYGDRSQSVRDNSTASQSAPHVAAKQDTIRAQIKPLNPRQMQTIAEIVAADGLALTNQVNALARQWGVSTSPKEDKEALQALASKSSLKPSKSEE